MLPCSVAHKVQFRDTVKAYTQHDKQLALLICIFSFECITCEMLLQACFYLQLQVTIIGLELFKSVSHQMTNIKKKGTVSFNLTNTVFREVPYRVTNDRFETAYNRNRLQVCS